MSGPDAEPRLRRAIECAADAAGLRLRIVRSAATRWASATFAGARHEIVLEGDQDIKFEQWLIALPEAELPLRDHLVADLKVVAKQSKGAVTTATLEILTVEES